MADKVRETVLKVIEPKLEELGVSDYDVNIKRATINGDNYLGIISQIQVNGKNEDGEEVEYNWIAKTSHQSPKLREYLHVDIIFDREIFMYSVVIPTLKAFQDEKNVAEPFTGFPDLIACSTDDHFEILVMDDIKTKDFRLIPRKEPVSYETAKLVMRQYGKFHALSYALHDQNPKLFKQVAEKLPEAFFKNMRVVEYDDIRLKYVENIISNLDSDRDVAEIELLKSLEGRFSDIIDNTRRPLEKYGVVTHGDCWINNMMFKFEDDKDANPTQMCLLDFQLSCFTSPATDLSYFLFTCTDKKLRDEHYDDLLKEYHTSLCNHMKSLGSDSEKYLTYEEFLGQMQEHAAYGFLMCIMVISLMCSDADEIPEFTDDLNSDMMIFESKSRDKITERINDVVRDFVRLGYNI